MSDLQGAARRVARRLADAGHEVWLAGGCVRDHLLGLVPKDYDLATSAVPDDVQATFRRTVAIGKQFGVITVLDGPHSFEVATFRSDGAYGDGRRPDEIHFTNAVEDVRRRDFTINGLLMDPFTDEIVDHVGGVSDLEAGIIRTIGEPAERFGEDHLRILRAVRFAARLGFELADETAAAMHSLRQTLSRPSAERVFGELDRMWTEKSPACAMELLVSLELLAVILPAVAAKSESACPPRLRGECAHGASLLDRTQAVLAGLQGGELISPLVWSVVLADLEDKGPQACARAGAGLLKQLHASKRLIEAVAALIVGRDRSLFATRISPARRSLVGAHALNDLFCLQHQVESLCVGESLPERHPTEFARRELPQPLLRGEELMDLGVAKGRGLGRFMRMLRYLQLNEVLKDQQAAREWINSRLSE